MLRFGINKSNKRHVRLYGIVFLWLVRGVVEKHYQTLLILTENNYRLRRLHHCEFLAKSNIHTIFFLNRSNMFLPTIIFRIVALSYARLSRYQVAKTKLYCFIFLFYFYIYPPDSHESDGGANT